MKSERAGLVMHADVGDSGWPREGSAADNGHVASPMVGPWRFVCGGIESDSPRDDGR